MYKLKENLSEPVDKGFQGKRGKSEASVYLRNRHWKMLEEKAEDGEYRSKNGVLREILDEYFDIDEVGEK